MMQIREIRYSRGDETSAPCVHFEIDGKEYLITAGRGSVTVIAGAYWIQSRRALGKTFWNRDDLVAHYRQHGLELLRQANRIANW